MHIIHNKHKIVNPPNFISYPNIKSPSEKIECEVCGKKLKQISWNHLFIHKMTVDQYKEQYKLPYGVGLTSNELKEKKRKRQYKLMKLGRVHLIKPGDPQFTGGIRKGSHVFSPSAGIKLKGVRKSPASGIKQSKTMKLLMKKRPELLQILLKNQVRKTCFICSYYNRRQIENLILKGIPDQKIAILTPVTRTSIQRHRMQCMNIIAPKTEKGHLRRISNRKTMKCLVCKKEFTYYHYSYYKYERKICSNRCKSEFMKNKI